MLNFFRRYYLQHGLSREVFELFLTVSIQAFALSIFVLFEPIYLYTLGYSISWILFFYLLVYILYFFAVPLGGKIAVWLGFEHSIAWSFLFLFLYLLSLYFMQHYSLFFYVSVVMLLLQKMFYWPAFHANFSRYGSLRSFGKEVGFLRSVFSILSIVGPLAGGLILSRFGFTVLFIVVGLILVLSVIPIFSTLEKFTPGHFSYWEAFRFFFSKKMRRILVSLIGLSNEIVDMVIWPIFLFIVLKEFASLGLVISLSALVLFVVVLFIGKYADVVKRSKLAAIIAPFHAVGFLFRFLAVTPLFAFLVSSITSAGKGSIDVVVYSGMYTLGRKYGNVKAAVFFDMCFAFYKMLILLVLLALVFIFSSASPFMIAFIVGAVVSLSFFLFR